MTTGPTLNFNQATKAATCSASTLRRRLYNGELEGAHKSEEDGTWIIPIASLIQAGLMPATTEPDQPEDDVYSDRIDQLERQNLELRHRAEMAEALATERAHALGDLRTAYADARRALGTGTPLPESTPDDWYSFEDLPSSDPEKVQASTPSPSTTVWLRSLKTRVGRWVNT